MELVYVLRTLWERKWWVLGAFLIAVAASVYARAELGSGSRYAVASQEVLLDAPSSTLGDLRRNIEPLTARGGVFARVLTSEEVIAEIGDRSGIPERRISVQGPPLMVYGVPDQSTRQRTQGAPAAPYQVSVLRGDDLPLLSISTRAPTPEEAARLAEGTTAALVSLVERVQEQSAVPEGRRLTVRILGEPKGRVAVDEPQKLMIPVVFLATFGIGVLMILFAPELLRAMREVDPHKPPSPVGATANGNGNGDLHADADQVEDLATIFEAPATGSDHPNPEGKRTRAGGDDPRRHLERRSRG